MARYLKLLSLFAVGIGGGKKDHEMKGYVDEFYIFNRTLAVDELAQIHDRCKGPMSAKILHLTFENTTANLTYDTSYQGNDGYLIGQAIEGDFPTLFCK